MKAGIALCSDNWWVEGEKAYFCPADIGVLLCADLNKKSLDMVAQIPDCVFRQYRANAYCLKFGNSIFCVPYNGKEICYYNIEKSEWGKIEIGYKDRLMVCLERQEKDNEIIWLLEYQGRVVYQVDLKEKVLKKKYSLSQDMHIFTGNYVQVQHNLYCVAGKNIYVINTKKDCGINQYELSDVQAALYTICYDGANFWLSGEDNEIYIWNPTQGVIKRIAGFLEKFDSFSLKRNIIADPIPRFSYSVSLGENVWYIPLQGNIPIIYIDKRYYKIRVFDILEEIETEESLLKRGTAFKYILLYIRHNRYIGLYSCKNQIVWEIDTDELCVEKKEYHFSDGSIYDLAYAYHRTIGMLSEGYSMDEEVYSILMKSNEKDLSHFRKEVGKEIYLKM